MSNFCCCFSIVAGFVLINCLGSLSKGITFGVSLDSFLSFLVLVISAVGSTGICGVGEAGVTSGSGDIGVVSTTSMASGDCGVSTSDFLLLFFGCCLLSSSSGTSIGMISGDFGVSKSS